MRGSTARKPAAAAHVAAAAAPPPSNSQVVLTGLQGVGKTTVANQLVKSLLQLNARTAVGAGEVSVVEEETLQALDEGAAAADDTDDDADDATLTAKEIAAQEYGDLCLSVEGRRSLTAVEQQPATDLLPLSPSLLSFTIKKIPAHDLQLHPHASNNDANAPRAPCVARVTVVYRSAEEVARLVSRGRAAHHLSGGPGDEGADAHANQKEEVGLRHFSRLGTFHHTPRYFAA
jgi:DNA polymerase III delta prime subunit